MAFGYENLDCVKVTVEPDDQAIVLYTEYNGKFDESVFTITETKRLIKTLQEAVEFLGKPRKPWTKRVI